MTTGLVTRPIVSVETAGATTPIIANVACVNAGVEYSYILPIGCQGYIIQPRKGLGDLKLSYVSGQTGTNYIYLPPNTFRSIGGLQTTTLLTVYFQSSVSGTIVEIESWT